MKNLLTLLAAMTSLSAYTLVGVHATCAACPPSLGNLASTIRCVDNKGITFCNYEKAGITSRHCYYNNKGEIQIHSNALCQGKVQTTTCPSLCK
ncbi:hypothetical protein PAXRUDRAFT_833520 [Paxillus rubicundulus Ve08.2h10]|uniref:Secreted protein n=1 Tax=Paxillus rubicundulus Ve08.2h10 TaxID=930991 RepID=A0A0D0D9L6_9AGAM|nr:hypothetical protein PAXRUDRAFT_833520 [Paxillus rubicundulus Ve08.2h10]